MITAIINGDTYEIADELSFEDDMKMRGHYGKKFIIRFTDGPHNGMVFYTTNLFHTGPTNCSNNAVFDDNAIPEYEFEDGKIIHITRFKRLNKH